ncbi:hypothetical protein B0J17DRAFT_666940 [Rhizoctonia solani]|nr:hypothetical protein B0J17DRAFT_666940 [Rhizoctonia solani]
MVSAALIIIGLSLVGVFASPTPVEGGKRQYPPGTDPIFQPCLPDGAAICHQAGTWHITYTDPSQGCFYGAGPLCCNRGPNQGCVLWTTSGGYCNVWPETSTPTVPTSTGSESDSVAPTSTVSLE